MDNFLEALNDDQLQAVVAPDDVPVVVLAGPGSGKTHVLVSRVAWLVNNLGYRPADIAVTTFTRKAASELNTRLSRFIPNSGDLSISTIHSLCLRIIKRQGFDQDPVKDGYLKIALGKIMETSQFYTPNIRSNTDKVGWKWMHQWVQSAKLDLVPPEHSLIWFRGKIASSIDPNERAGPMVIQDVGSWMADCYQRLQVKMDQDRMIDYADMLAIAWQVIDFDREKWGRYFSYILCDEAQDTSRLQLDILNVLAGGERLFIVGDTDQSIYMWRNATPDNIGLFLDEHPDHLLYKLETNYRSTQEIVRLSRNLISYAEQDERQSKAIIPRPDAEPGIEIVERSFPIDTDEAAWVGREVERLIKQEDYEPKDIFCIYRTNAQSQLIEEELVTRNIPYSVSSGNGFWSRLAVRDVLAILQLSVDPSDNPSFEQVFNKASWDFPTATRFLGRAFLAECYEHIPSDSSSLWAGMGALYHSHEVQQGSRRRWARSILDFTSMISTLSQISHESRLEQTASWYNQWFHRDEGAADTDDIVTDTMESLVRAGEKFISTKDFLDDVRMLQAIAKQRNKKNAVYLTTVHSAKGLESRAVFGMGLNDSVLPHWSSGGTTPDIMTPAGTLFQVKRNPWLPSFHSGTVNDERYVAYVLMTRSMERLYLTWSGQQGKKVGLAPSRFLSEIRAAYTQPVELEPTSRMLILDT